MLGDPAGIVASLSPLAVPVALLFCQVMICLSFDHSTDGYIAAAFTSIAVLFTVQQADGRELPAASLYPRSYNASHAYAAHAYAGSLQHRQRIIFL